MPLTDIAVKQAKPQDKNFKLSDAGGLFLLKPNGGNTGGSNIVTPAKRNC